MKDFIKNIKADKLNFRGFYNKFFFGIFTFYIF